MKLVITKKTPILVNWIICKLVYIFEANLPWKLIMVILQGKLILKLGLHPLLALDWTLKKILQKHGYD